MKKKLKWFSRYTGEQLEKENAKGETHKKSYKYLKDGTMKNSVDLEKYEKDAKQWIYEVATWLKLDPERSVSWNVLKVVLHSLRDRLPVEETFHFSAQLPLLIRGAFFEGYRVTGKPEKFHKSEIEKRLTKVLPPTLKIDARDAFKAVLLVLHDHVSTGELEDIYENMPKDIKQLWDESLKTHSI
ncbi:DUF2267 domain-containing protein [Fodinibius saliphilus]|uniref:DUF2267 domain-containing protein n=1 Tax=Fodinibius saliphilus TaxID=1920650 RepID=UPI00110866CA|nr:DUF2267 domain-containing protein [Fodinibius saliphilus]